MFALIFTARALPMIIRSVSGCRGWRDHRTPTGYLVAHPFGRYAVAVGDERHRRTPDSFVVAYAVVSEVNFGSEFDHLELIDGDNCWSVSYSVGNGRGRSRRPPFARRWRPSRIWARRCGPNAPAPS